MLRQEVETAEEEVEGQRKKEKKNVINCTGKKPKRFIEVQVALELLGFLGTILRTVVPYI